LTVSSIFFCPDGQLEEPIELMFTEKFSSSWKDIGALNLKLFPEDSFQKIDGLDISNEQVG
jgi:hypothetical protein